MDEKDCDRGDGRGDGNGYGNCDGCGDGYGRGYARGRGDDDGRGNGWGDGDFDGDGSGSGWGDGSGNGWGDGWGRADGTGNSTRLYLSNSTHSNNKNLFGKLLGYLKTFVKTRETKGARMSTITIDGKKYKQVEETQEGVPYVIVRTYSAGVFAGYLIDRNGKEGIMKDARRLWFWSGAASLSQLSQEGVKKPNECKFPCTVRRLELTEIIEVLYCTEAARKSIAGVPIWSA